VSRGARAGDERATRGDATRPDRGDRRKARTQNHVGDAECRGEEHYNYSLQSYSPTQQHSTARRGTAQKHIAAAHRRSTAQHSTSGSQDLSGVQAPVQGICSMIGIHWIIRGSGPGERANAMGSSPDPKYCPLRTSPRSTLTHTRSQCGRVDPAA
jgi:hypothetical protein